MKTARYISFSVAILVVATFSSFSQAIRPDFNRPQTFDAQHYVIRVSFDAVKKKLFGDTTVTVKPLKADFRSIELDAVDLAFDSVTLDPAGTNLQFKTVNGKVVVTLDKAYGPTDVISIRLKYTTTPNKGVYFRAANTSNDQVNHSSQIWSQGEADENRHWFPSFDFPSDKATTEEYITAQKDEVAIGNGELLGKSDNADGTVTWHYKMLVPHSTYLVSFVVGKYSRVDDKYKDIPLGFYVYPGKEETGKKAFGGTKDMIRVYEELTGVPFPYNKYDQTIVSEFQFGGMENITATTMNDSEIFLADFDFGKNIVTDLVSHELAHSWFGDMLTCKNWAELWLNEGFATYMEAAYREKAFGRDDYMRKIRSDAGEFLVGDSLAKKKYGLFNRTANNVAGLFDDSSVTYNKGGAVIHMLREQVGTENFWKAINIYLNRHKFANVETPDLKKAMEETSGQDLTWFFDQWVYDVGAPKLTVKQVYNSRTKKLTLTITQTQKPDALTPQAFRMPMEVEIDGGKVEPILMTKRLQTFTISSARKPKEVVLDPDDKVVVKTVKMLPLTTIR